MFHRYAEAAQRIGAAFLVSVSLAAPIAAVAEPKDVTLQHGGLNLNGRLVTIDGQNLAEGVVLILHGTLAHNRMEIIATLQNALEERGIASLAVTLGLGIDDRRGMYPCTTPHRHRHTDAFDELSAWLGWLAGQGAKNVVLIGHSRGGNQVARFAAERKSDLVRRAVLLAPATWDADGRFIAYQKSNGALLRPLLERAEGLVAAGKADETMKVPGILYCKDTQATAGSFVSYYGDDPRHHTPAVLPEIDVPVLVIAGSEDRVVRGLPRAVAPLADGERVRLVVISGADHFFLDFFAEDAADAIAEFLGAE
jgi:pimeloyl-ACP methyl ester carboxylesterase